MSVVAKPVAQLALLSIFCAGGTPSTILGTQRIHKVYRKKKKTGCTGKRQTVLTEQQAWVPLLWFCASIPVLPLHPAGGGADSHPDSEAFSISYIKSESCVRDFEATKYLH